MPEDIYDLYKKFGAQLLTAPYSTIAGDIIAIRCRNKPGNWEKVRYSENHHCFQTTVKKNCVAVIMRAYTSTGRE